MVVPMFIGVALAMLLDGFLLYKLFNTKLFPATGAWPHGVAAAESIKAGDQGGKQAVLLGIGIFLGALGSFFKFPTAALGTAFIGNVWALGMLGIGFLLRGYSSPVFGIDINALYIPDRFRQRHVSPHVGGLAHRLHVLCSFCGIRA